MLAVPQCMRLVLLGPLTSTLSATAVASTSRAAVPASTMSAAGKRKRAGLQATAAADDADARYSGAGGGGARPLTLYFDINETIMVGDPAGGDTYEDCLNKMICKAAFVRPNLSQSSTRAGRWSEWVWHDGSPLDPSARREGMGVPALLFPWQRRRGLTQLYQPQRAPEPEPQTTTE